MMELYHSQIQSSFTGRITSVTQCTVGCALKVMIREESAGEHDPLFHTSLEEGEQCKGEEDW